MTSTNRTLRLCAGLALSLLVCVPAAGQGRAGANKLVGTWNITVTRETAPPGQPLSFPALYAFLPGNVMQETGSLTLYRSPGMGVWDRTDGRSYAAALEFYRFGPDGAYLGSTKAAITIELSAEGDSFTGTSAFQAFDAAGNPGFAGSVAIAGERMAVAAP
jgi:hypothetical protein